MTRVLGPDAVSLVRPTRVSLLDFFCSSIKLYVLLIPYRCFISILYLDFYVHGDDTLISWGPFMQVKYLCVLVHIRTNSL